MRLRWTTLLGVAFLVSTSIACAAVRRMRTPAPQTVSVVDGQAARVDLGNARSAGCC